MSNLNYVDIGSSHPSILDASRFFSWMVTSGGSLESELTQFFTSNPDRSTMQEGFDSIVNAHFKGLNLRLDEYLPTDKLCFVVNGCEISADGGMHMDYTFYDDEAEVSTLAIVRHYADGRANVSLIVEGEVKWSSELSDIEVEERDGYYVLDGYLNGELVVTGTQEFNPSVSSFALSRPDGITEGTSSDTVPTDDAQLDVISYREGHPEAFKALDALSDQFHEFVWYTYRQGRVFGFNKYNKWLTDLLRLELGDLSAPYEISFVNLTEDDQVGVIMSFKGIEIALLAEKFVYDLAEYAVIKRDLEAFAKWVSETDDIGATAHALQDEEKARQLVTNYNMGLGLGFMTSYTEGSDVHLCFKNWVSLKFNVDDLTHEVQVGRSDVYMGV